MNLPKVNGKVDTEMVSDALVTHILVESIVKHCRARISHDEKKELEKYVKDILDTIINETTNQ